MNILLVNTSETTGGAAIATHRLVRALNHQGVKARMLVRDKQSTSVTTSAIPARLRLWASFLWERICIWVANRFRRRGLWDVDIANAGVDITSQPEFRDADVVHLNWVNQGLLSMHQIEKILHSGKPVVWTLHDFWPVCAICHHPGDCERYVQHCQYCPQLFVGRRRDLSWRVFQQKLRAYSNAPITFVAVSQWVAERARNSALVKGHPVVVIPNIVPISQLHRIDKQEARSQMGIAATARIVVFGAARIDQPLKGFDRLIEALGLLKTNTQRGTGSETGHELRLLLFGNCKDRDVLNRIPCAYTYFGTVSDAATLGRIYSAADVVVSASDYETFGLTLAEAMACGCTPVSFDRGGQTDIISHRINGYLAHYPDTDDLAAGIEWAFAANLPAEGQHASAASHFGEEAVARRHIQLYESLCKAQSTQS